MREKYWQGVNVKPASVCWKMAAILVFTGVTGVAQAAAGDAQPGIDALVAAAKAEGEVTLYSAATANVATRVGTAFSKKYDIKFSLVRLSTAPLQRKYFAEAEAGTFAADIIITAGGGAPYTTDGIERGWIEPISAAKLPVLTGGSFPSKFSDGVSPIIQVSPWTIAYNTELVKGGEIPREWTQLLDPKWKGKILLADPRVGTVFTQYWMLMLDKYGEQFFTKLRALEPRRYPSGVPAAQGLGAGEGALYIPVIPGLLAAVKSKGAPVDSVTPDLTTGVQFYVVLTAKSKAKHPSAGRLFANYLLSPDGNAVFNDDPGVAGVYDSGKLPKKYEMPKDVTNAHVDLAAKLLGY